MKDYYPSVLSSYTQSGQNTYTQDTMDKSSKQANFRNFQLPSASKGASYSALERFKWRRIIAE